MTDLTKFIHVRFLSVVQAEIALEQLWEPLSEAGFKPFGHGIQQNGISLICRDVLFNQASLKSTDVNELGQKEYQCLNNIFKIKQIPAKCLTSMVLQSEMFNIPTKDVINDGRTVCLEVYPQLECYVE